MSYNYHLLFKYILLGDVSTIFINKMLEKARSSQGLPTTSSMIIISLLLV